MTTFNDREHAFEDKFKRDEEAKFKIRAKRNRLFGEWVAGVLGLDGKDAEEYAVSIVLEDLKLPGDEDITDKVLADLAEKGIAMAVEELNKQLVVFLREGQDEYKKDLGIK